MYNYSVVFITKSGLMEVFNVFVKDSSTDYIAVKDGKITEINYGGYIVKREEKEFVNSLDCENFEEFLYETLSYMKKWQPSQFELLYEEIREEPLFYIAETVNELF